MKQIFGTVAGLLIGFALFSPPDSLFLLGPAAVAVLASLDYIINGE